MSREQERIRRKLENNPVVECNKIRNKYCPDLFHDFADTKDPRNQSYTKYYNDELLGTVFYKGIAGIESMQSMTYEFNRERVVENLFRFMEKKRKNISLMPSRSINILRDWIRMIRSKAFYDARFQKKWLVIVDGTQTYSGNRKLNDSRLERHYNKGTEEETVNYHCDVLEAKIVFGESLIVSIASEFIENNGEDAQRQKTMSEEKRKQDCETKAFKRLAGKIKKAFPRLSIVLLADSLYASEPVMDICRDNGWEFIIRYKTGSIPCIAEEYEKIPEKETSGHAEFINGIDYNGKAVNMLRFWEEKIVKGETVRTDFQWLTSIWITKKNAEKIAGAGRKRWKIENEGFNRQKNWQGDITHACSHDATAMKNHYLMTQISDMVKQLYEWFCLKARGIKKKQKIYLPNC